MERRRARRGSSVSARSFALELEPAGADCASRRIGGGAAVSGLSAEDGDAGRRAGCRFDICCRPPHTHPSRAWVGHPLRSVSTAWVPLGPAPLASDATGDGGQDYNWVSGRATSVLIDPADTSGNTVLLGGAYGGLWKSINAGSLSSNPASVIWQPLIDDQPTLAVGAIALQPGNSNVILVGTGETNSSADSYYGLGILLSTNAGSTWTEITGIGQAPNGTNRFLGIGFSKIAFSTANPNLVVAATAGDNGLCLGLEAATAGDNSPLSCLGPEEDGNSTVRRTLLLAEWWSDVEPRNPHGRRRSRIGHGGDLQREPGERAGLSTLSSGVTGCTHRRMARTSRR